MAKKSSKKGSKKYDVDKKLKEWATPRQAETIDALIKHRSVAAAAEALGITPSRLRGHMSEARRRAARRGWSPDHDMTKTVPDGFFVKGVSGYYDEDGNLKGQWVKSQVSQEHRFVQVMDAVSAAAEKFEGIARPVKPPKHKSEDLLAVIPWGDPHIGLFAWAAETGDRDYDLKTAEDIHFRATDHLVGLAPPAKRCAIISVGDLFHADNQQNRTMRSGHVLDVDTRYAKVYRTIFMLLARALHRALEKFEEVEFHSMAGNHDDISAYTVGVCVDAWFRNEPRVKVDLSPNRFHWIRHGKCLLGSSHGDTCKPEKMGQVMANDCASDWGETLFRHIYSGHIHKDKLVDAGGCMVESIRTMAPLDAFAAAGGWRSGSDMKMDIWHAERGRINRHIVGIESLGT